MMSQQGTEYLGILLLIFCSELDVGAAHPCAPCMGTAGGRGEDGDEEEEEDDEVQAEAVQAGGGEHRDQQPRHRAQLDRHPPPAAAVHVLRGHGSLMSLCWVTVHCQKS